MELEKFDKYRVVFFTGPAQKVLSVEDCKIPNKKVKVGFAFLFLLGIFQSYIFRTFRAGPKRKYPERPWE